MFSEEASLRLVLSLKGFWGSSVRPVWEHGGLFRLWRRFWCPVQNIRWFRFGSWSKGSSRCEKGTRSSFPWHGCRRWISGIFEKYPKWFRIEQARFPKSTHNFLGDDRLFFAVPLALISEPGCGRLNIFFVEGKGFAAFGQTEKALEAFVELMEQFLILDF